MYDRPLMSLLFYCRKLLLGFKIFKIRHLLRDSNVVADSFAKETVDYEDSFLVILNSLTKTLKFLVFDGRVENPID